MIAKAPDRLDRARQGLLLLTALVVVMAMLALALITMPRDMVQPTQIVMRQLNLNTPTLFPSGRVWRDGAYAHPAVDLRHGPQIPLFACFPEDLLAGSLQPGRRGTP